jgi:hypothetical protein
MIINNSSFKLTEIPNLNPHLDSYEYIEFWRSVKRNIVEGYRVSGKWMPGPLWYGQNFHNIMLEDPMGNQKMGLMSVSDIAWEIYYIYEEARGFSGFHGTDVSCNRLLLDDLSDQELRDRCYVSGNSIFKPLYDNLFKADGTRKKYVPAAEELRKLQAIDGYPIYFNEARNVPIIGCRGLGKTVIASVLANHNIITDGANNYDYYLENLTSGNKLKSNTLIASQEMKYVSTISDYIRLGLENLAGDCVYGSEIIPSPLKKEYAIGTDWKVGSTAGVKFHNGTQLLSRVFTDNIFSSNSGRPNLSIIDEFAFIKHIKDVLTSIEGSSAAKKRKNNVIFCIATGGYAKGDTVRYAEDIFYNPETFNFLSFPDIYEDRGKIGYFIPITLGSMKYKRGENLETDLEYAIKDQQAERAKRAKDRHALQGYIVNNPLIPSEAFLLGDNDIFPAAILKQQHTSLMKDDDLGHKLKESFKGRFIEESDGRVNFEVTTAMPIRDYPLQDASLKAKEGCVEMWQKPVLDEMGLVQKGRYIASADVVRNDIIGSSDSLPSLFVFDRYTRQIVLEYTGRTNNTKDFYNQAYLICKFYSAKLMYEKNINAMFTYFDHLKATHLLADTPYQFRSKEEAFIVGTNTSKGISANASVIEQGIRLINDWFSSPSMTTAGKSQIYHIYSPALLLEAIKYTGTNNTDRISSLIVLFLYDDTLKKIELKENTEKRKNFIDIYIERGRERFNFKKREI